MGLEGQKSLALSVKQYQKGRETPLTEGGAGNGRNGYGKKTVTTEAGRLELDIPRDRQASFDPQLIAKYQHRFPGFDDKIISM